MNHLLDQARSLRTQFSVHYLDDGLKRWSCCQSAVGRVPGHDWTECMAAILSHDPQALPHGNPVAGRQKTGRAE